MWDDGPTNFKLREYNEINNLGDTIYAAGDHGLFDDAGSCLAVSTAFLRTKR